MHSHSHSHDHGHCSHGNPLAHVPAGELTPAESEFMGRFGEPTPTAPPADIFTAARQGNLERIKELVASGTKDILRSRDEKGHTVLHWAAQRGDIPMLEWLADNGAPLNEPSADDVQLHPIHWACTKGKLEALHFLVQRGVNINTADGNRSRTALLLSAQYGFPLLVMYCIKNGANIDILDADKDSAIHWAAYKGSADIIAIFQYLGLSTDAPDRFGQTPLHLAAMRGNLAAVEYLVEELDSDMSKRDGKNRTPLDLAMVKKNHDVIRYLKKKEIVNRWNVFSWWESSSMPFYFVFVNILFGYYIYYARFLPDMPDQSRIYMLHFITNVFSWLFFVLTWRTSPGFLRTDKVCSSKYDKILAAIAGHGRNVAEDNVNMHQPLCHTCHIQRPLRSKHCRVCKSCVSEFDHHCPFVGNCVGKGNYPYFYGFLIAITGNALIMCVILYRHWSLIGFQWLIFLNIFNYGLTAFLVGNMLIFHTYLTYKNLTTNEIANASRYAYLQSGGRYFNPFNRGPVQNAIQRLCPSLRHSENDPIQLV